MLKKLCLSRICFGCEPLGGSDWGPVDVAKIADAVERAIELGVNFFDTADVYGLGLSEERLGKILGPRRHDVVIATKGGLSWQHSPLGKRAKIQRDSSPEYLRMGVEASLRRLRIDFLPIYFIHWPDPNTDIRVSFECLAKLQHEGKIGLIGCSNFNAEQLRMACQAAEVSLVQLPLNCLDEGVDSDMVELLREKKIGVMAYNVLANGLLTGKYGPRDQFPDSDRRSRLPRFVGRAYQKALLRVAEVSAAAHSKGLSCAQFSIASVLERPEVVSAIVGIKSREQIEENIFSFETKPQKQHFPKLENMQ
jgi:aryl-alcohol dehydrogenase-like predicted oxidoreductase